MFIDILSQMSPLSERESQDIMESLNSKIIGTFKYAIVLAFCRFVAALISFWYAEFQVIWIPAFLSGLLSIIPVLSSWIVWIPTSLFLLARDGFWSTPWAFMVLVHILLIVVDTFLYNNFFKDQKPEVLGLSIVLGIYAFGGTGIIKGPLSVGLTITLLEIYLKYMTVDPNELSSSFHNLKTPATNRLVQRRRWTRSATQSIAHAVIGLFGPDDVDSPSNDDENNHSTSTRNNTDHTSNVVNKNLEFETPPKSERVDVVTKYYGE
jgi:hypothetical protein